MLVEDFATIFWVHGIKVSRGVRKKAAEELKHFVAVDMRDLLGELFPGISFLKDLQDPPEIPSTKYLAPTYTWSYLVYMPRAHRALRPNRTTMNLLSPSWWGIQRGIEVA
jgi:hypothetical protein